MADDKGSRLVELSPVTVRRLRSVAKSLDGVTLDVAAVYVLSLGLEVLDKRRRLAASRARRHG